MTGDPLPEARGSECGRVVDPHRIERGMGRLNRRFRRRSGRLAHLHVNHVAAGRLDTGGRRHHVHHHECRDVAAPRSCGQNGLRAFAQCRFKHLYLLQVSCSGSDIPVVSRRELWVRTQTSLNPRIVRAYRGSNPPPIHKEYLMLLRFALLRKTTKLIATATAIALVAVPTAAFAQEEKLRHPARHRERAVAA